MPTLKMDGQNCCALLLGLRNDYRLHHFFAQTTSKQTYPSFLPATVCNIVCNVRKKDRRL